MKVHDDTFPELGCLIEKKRLSKGLSLNALRILMDKERRFTYVIDRVEMGYYKSYLHLIRHLVDFLEITDEELAAINFGLKFRFHPEASIVFKEILKRI